MLSNVAPNGSLVYYECDAKACRVRISLTCKSVNVAVKRSPPNKTTNSNIEIRVLDFFVISCTPFG